MSKNKHKPNTQPPLVSLIQDPPQAILTNQQKATNLINLTNDNMFQSIQLGDMTIQDVDEIAKSLIQQQWQSIFYEILQGQFEVHHQPIPYNISKRKLQKYKNLHDDLQDQLTSKVGMDSPDQSQIHKINASLKQLQDSIRRQRQLEKNEQKKLQQKAKQFIQKVQKEKQQFEQKLKNKKSSSRLFARAYSQDTIRVMKDKLAERVQEKKEKLAQRLKSIQKRKGERLQQSVNGEVSYWQKVKQYESQKTNQYHSCKNLKRQQTGDSVLPSIKQPLTSSRSSTHQKDKNHFLKRFLKQQKSASALENKFHKIDQYVLKAKLKLHQFQNHSQNQQTNYGLRIHQNKNHSNFDDLYISNQSHLSTNQDHSEHRFNLIDRIRQDLEQSKLKMAMDDKKSPRNPSKSSLKIHVELSPLMGISKEINPEHDNLSVNASNLKPSKNPKQVQLKDSWSTVLNKIKFHEINKIEGLAQLSGIEKRLDKYDKEGIVNRLKMKATVIAEIERERKGVFESKQIENLRQKQKVFEQNQQIKVKGKCSSVSEQKKKGLNSSQNEFISKQFKRKALMKA